MNPAFDIAAEHFSAAKKGLLEHWRNLVLADAQLPESRLSLTPEQLEDHLPDLLDSIANNLRGEELSEDAVRRPAARHGRTRRAQGYSISQLIREIAIFRMLLRESLEQLARHISGEDLFTVREAVLRLTDISELGSVEQYVEEERLERDAAREELRKADEQKDHFLAVLSHELRNPLASIRTAADILQSEHTSTFERQRALEIIERQTRYQTRLIDDLLDMNRISQGKIELRC
jgi:signal transduction histidine kinase